MHAEGGVPARGVRYLDRGDRRAIVAKIMRTMADPGAASFHLRPGAARLQLPHAVGRQESPAPTSPSAGACSWTDTSKPRAISAFAAKSPPIPPPMITTLSCG